MKRRSEIAVRGAAQPAVVLLVAGLATGCAAEGGESSATRGFEIRDSAGVAVASSEGPAWPPNVGWRVRDVPSLEIGGAEGDPASRLHDVRDAVRLSDGRIVVAERSTNRIKYFAPTGEFLCAVGGSGDGPGEYRLLTDIRRRRGDSLLVFDPARARVTLLDESGETVKTVDLTGDGERLVIGSVLQLDDGRFLGAGTWSTGQIGVAAPPGVHRPNTAALRFGPDGSLEDTVAVYPSADMARVTIQGETRRGLTLFSRITTTAFHADRLYVGTGESLEVRVFDPSGELTLIVRAPTPDLAITPRAISEQQDAMRGDYDDPRVVAYFDALFDAMPLPDEKPAFEEMFVDVAGNIWLSPFRGELETDEPWTVFGADGRLLGTVDMPRSIEVLDIDDEYIIVVWRNELDVESVRIYPIQRTSTPAGTGP